MTAEGNKKKLITNQVEERVESYKDKEIIILLGPPTSGKTSQMLYLNITTGMPVLRGRDVLPDMTSSKEIERKLISDRLFIPALKNKLHNLKDQNVILENIPRTKRQAKLLKKWAEQNGHKIVVISLELNQSQVLERSNQRLECPICHLAYHPQLKPPKTNGKCDIHDEAILERRPGDKPNLLIKAVERHQKAKKLILDQLGKAAVYEITASGTVGEVSKVIKQKLNLK